MTKLYVYLKDNKHYWCKYDRRCKLVNVYNEKPKERLERTSYSNQVKKKYFFKNFLDIADYRDRRIEHIFL